MSYFIFFGGKQSLLLGFDAAAWDTRREKNNRYLCDISKRAEGYL